MNQKSNFMIHKESFSKAMEWVASRWEMLASSFSKIPCADPGSMCESTCCCVKKSKKEGSNDDLAFFILLFRGKCVTLPRKMAC